MDEFEPFYKAFARNREQVRPAPAGAFGWDPNTALSNYAAKLVFESIPNGAVRPRREQVNSRAQYLRDLEGEIDAIIAAAAEGGCNVDKQAMPGYKSDLIQILVSRNSQRAGRASSTYSKDFRELGLRWVGGRNRSVGCCRFGGHRPKLLALSRTLSD
ncbi:MAG: hypothetical protein H0T80_15235 [Betaproteobacteria bacterium]|nr:hypothetical protein [Betaproteobacteria bacterium]